MPTVNRVIDTRTGTGGPQRPASPNQIRQVAISELYGVPGNAVGVMLNVTAIKPRRRHRPPPGLGHGPAAPRLHAQLHPGRGDRERGAGRPGRQQRAERRAVFGIYNSSSDTTDVIADVSGYFVGG